LHECGRPRRADLAGDKPGAQITMEAEVSGSLRRTQSRPPRSALGLDGVGAPRQAPVRRASNPIRFQAARLHGSADFSRSIVRCPSRFFATLESQRRPQGPSRSEVRGSRRRLAPPTLAIIRLRRGWAENAGNKVVAEAWCEADFVLSGEIMDTRAAEAPPQAGGAPATRRNPYSRIWRPLAAASVCGSWAITGGLACHGGPHVELWTPTH